MFITPLTIKSLFADSPGRLHAPSEMPIFNRCETVQSLTGLTDRHCCYLLTGNDFPPGPYPDGVSFVFFSKGPLPDTLPEPAPFCCLLLQQPDPAKPVKTIQNFFGQEYACGMFTDTLMEKLVANLGVQSMVDAGYEAIGNPIFLFDGRYQLIAANWDAAKQDDICRPMIEQQGFSPEDFEMVNQMNHIHEQVKKSPVPIRFHNDRFGIDQAVCSLDPAKDIGHLVVNAVNHPFTELDLKLLTVLKKMIREQMEKGDFIRSSRGFDYEYYLTDLLEGRLSGMIGARQRMAHLEKRLTGSFCCLVVDTSMSSAALNKFHVRAALESMLPGTKAVIFGSQIVAVLNTRSHHDFTEAQIDTVRKKCAESGLYAGLSIRFDHISQLHDYYEQAVRALELGILDHAEPGVYGYYDFCLQHLGCALKDRMKPEIFCHPKLRDLMEYDAANDTQYAETLYYYLLYERNLAEAAKAMFVHRNTMSYRLQKLKTMADILWDDPKERQYLILSYEFCRSSKVHTAD